MKHPKLLTLNTIGEFHEIAGLSRPEHPLVSVIDYSQVTYQTDNIEIGWLQQFYCIGLKRDINGRFRYGQQQYDFDAGIVSLVAPGQIVHINVEKSAVKPSGYYTLPAPGFFVEHGAGKKIKQYDYFGYAVNEALFVSDKEEEIIMAVLQNIQREYHSNIDAFSQGIIVAHLEVLLNYFDRFYQRQFITRQKTNHQILERLETILDDYFSSGDLVEKGLPGAQELAGMLHMSPNYLGSLLKSLTGQTTQQHIHSKLIDKAKEKLSTTSLSISEIAYELGFGHSQSFSKLFKSKTNQSPLEFRAGFN